MIPISNETDISGVLHFTWLAQVYSELPNGLFPHGYGCAGESVTIQDTIDMTTTDCCPTPNEVCLSYQGPDKGQSVLQNICTFPKTQGCNQPSYQNILVAGAPCCVPTGSPIIIDVDGHGYDLTSVDRGVKFDFYGLGKPSLISWTAKGSTNGFLVRDLYGTGQIVDAKEMFGNLTPQPKCKGTPNGFNALSQYDTNHDGWIDNQDPIWSDLKVWQDFNHNGITDPGELHSLDDLRVHRISIAHNVDRKVDANGNLFYYRGHIDDASNDKSVYDVFLIFGPVN